MPDTTTRLKTTAEEREQWGRLCDPDGFLCRAIDDAALAAELEAENAESNRQLKNLIIRLDEARTEAEEWRRNSVLRTNALASSERQVRELRDALREAVGLLQNDQHGVDGLDCPACVLVRRALPMLTYEPADSGGTTGPAREGP